jgi:hypothetical protein
MRLDPADAVARAAGCTEVDPTGLPCFLDMRDPSKTEVAAETIFCRLWIPTHCTSNFIRWAAAIREPDRRQASGGAS